MYCFFIIWILDGYKNIIKTKSKETVYSPFISIVIAARNEAKNISNLLKLLNKQSYPKDLYEIIIVDDRSDDGSRKILEKYKTKIDNLIVVPIDNCPSIWASKKWAIHNGIKISRGDIIIQTDADCYMGNNWVKSMVRPFEDLSVGFVSSMTPLMYNKNNIFKELFLMDSIAQDIFSGYGIGKDLILSCNARSIAYRKSHFLDMKGYHQIKDIISGDDDLVLHKIIHYIGCRVKFILHEEATVFSLPPVTFMQFINQRMRYASKGIIYYKMKFISKELKIILPFIYLINLLSVILIIKFCHTGQAIYLFALLFKIIPDYFMINSVYRNYNFKWNWLSYIILTVLHPFYIVSFAVIGPIYNLKWK